MSLHLPGVERTSPTASARRFARTDFDEDDEQLGEGSSPEAATTTSTTATGGEGVPGNGTVFLRTRSPKGQHTFSTSIVDTQSSFTGTAGDYAQQAGGSHGFLSSKTRKKRGLHCPRCQRTFTSVTALSGHAKQCGGGLQKIAVDALSPQASATVLGSAASSSGGSASPGGFARSPTRGERGRGDSGGSEELLNKVSVLTRRLDALKDVRDTALSSPAMHRHHQDGKHAASRVQLARLGLSPSPTKSSSPSRRAVAPEVTGVRRRFDPLQKGKVSREHAHFDFDGVTITSEPKPSDHESNISLNRPVADLPVVIGSKVPFSPHPEAQRHSPHTVASSDANKKVKPRSRQKERIVESDSDEATSSPQHSALRAAAMDLINASSDRASSPSCKSGNRSSQKTASGSPKRLAGPSPKALRRMRERVAQEAARQKRRQAESDAASDVASADRANSGDDVSNLAIGPWHREAAAAKQAAGEAAKQAAAMAESSFDANQVKSQSPDHNLSGQNKNSDRLGSRPSSASSVSPATSTFAARSGETKRHRSASRHRESKRRVGGSSNSDNDAYRESKVSMRTRPRRRQQRAQETVGAEDSDPPSEQTLPQRSHVTSSDRGSSPGPTDESNHCDDDRTIASQSSNGVAVDMTDNRSKHPTKAQALWSSTSSSGSQARSNQTEDFAADKVYAANTQSEEDAFEYLHGASDVSIGDRLQSNAGAGEHWYEVEIVDRTVVDRSASGDGSKLETRFVCRLLHYDMVWPRVRVDQLRREKVPPVLDDLVDPVPMNLKIHEEQDAENSALGNQFSYERSQTRSMTAGAPSEHTLTENSSESQPNEEVWYTSRPKYDPNQGHDLQESPASNKYQPTSSEHDDATVNDDTFAVVEQFPCSECHEMQDIPAVSVACMLGHADCLHALLHNAVLQHQAFNAGSSTGTPEGVDTAVVVEQMDWEDDHGRSPLHYAASSDLGLECLDMLLNFGFDSLALDANQRSPLHYACSNNAFCCVARLMEVSPDAACLRDSHGDFPLHAAVVTGSQECAQLLLQTGAEPNARNNTGHTAAYYASNAEMLDALFDNGCNLFCVDFDNRTLLAVAAAQGNADCTSFLCEIDDDQVMLNYGDVLQNTPLHAAAEFGHQIVVEVLLSSAANPLLRNADGWRPSDIAKAAGFDDVCDSLRRYEGFHEEAKPDLRPQTDLAALSGVAVAASTSSSTSPVPNRNNERPTAARPSTASSVVVEDLEKSGTGSDISLSHPAAQETVDFSSQQQGSGRSRSNEEHAEGQWDEGVATEVEARAWIRSFDDASGHYYFYNAVTHATTWTQPAEFVDHESLASLSGQSERPGSAASYNNTSPDDGELATPGGEGDGDYDDWQYDDEGNYYNGYEYDEDPTQPYHTLYASGNYDLSVPRNRDSYDATGWAHAQAHQEYWGYPAAEAGEGGNGEEGYGAYDEEQYYNEHGQEGYTGGYAAAEEYDYAHYDAATGSLETQQAYLTEPAFEALANKSSSVASPLQGAPADGSVQDTESDKGKSQQKKGEVAEAVRRKAKTPIALVPRGRKRDYLAMARAFVVEAPYLINGSDRRWCPPSLRRHKGTPRRQGSLAASPSATKLQALDNAMRLDEACFRCHRRAGGTSNSGANGVASPAARAANGEAENLEDPCRIEHIFLPCHHACLCKGCLAEKNLLQSSSRLRSDTPRGAALRNKLQRKTAEQRAKAAKPGATVSSTDAAGPGPIGSSTSASTSTTPTSQGNKSPSVAQAPQQFESRRLPKGTTCPLCKKPAKHLIHVKDIYALTARKFRRYRRLPEAFATSFEAAALKLKSKIQ